MSVADALARLMCRAKSCSRSVSSACARCRDIASTASSICLHRRPWAESDARDVNVRTSRSSCVESSRATDREPRGRAMRRHVAARVPAVGQRFRGEVRKKSTADWRSGSQKSFGGGASGAAPRANDDRRTGLVHDCRSPPGSRASRSMSCRGFDSDQRAHAPELRDLRHNCVLYEAVCKTSLRIGVFRNGAARFSSRISAFALQNASAASHLRSPRGNLHTFCS